MMGEISMKTVVLLILCYIQGRHALNSNIITVNVTYTNQTMNLTMADDRLYFSNFQIVRNQIHCVSECLKENHGNKYYYALYKKGGHQCVCKKDFDWRRITSISTSDNQIKRLQLRTGKYNSDI